MGRSKHPSRKELKKMTQEVEKLLTDRGYGGYITPLGAGTTVSIPANPDKKRKKKKKSNFYLEKKSAKQIRDWTIGKIADITTTRNFFLQQQIHDLKCIVAAMLYYMERDDDKMIEMLKSGLKEVYASASRKMIDDGGHYQSPELIGQIISSVPNTYRSLDYCISEIFGGSMEPFQDISRHPIPNDKGDDHEGSTDTESAEIEMIRYSKYRDLYNYAHDIEGKFLKLREILHYKNMDFINDEVPAPDDHDLLGEIIPPDTFMTLGEVTDKGGFPYDGNARAIESDDEDDD